MAAQEQPAEGTGSLRNKHYDLVFVFVFQVKSLCASLLDSNVLVQRNNLEIILFFFPFYTCLVSHVCPPGHFLLLQRQRAGVCIHSSSVMELSHLAGSTHLGPWMALIYSVGLCDLSWEEVNRWFFMPDRAPATGQGVTPPSPAWRNNGFVW